MACVVNEEHTSLLVSDNEVLRIVLGELALLCSISVGKYSAIVAAAVSCRSNYDR